MSWKLLWSLSLMALGMGLGTIELISNTVEPWLWLGIFVIAAVAIARTRRDRLFLHGLVLGLLNCIWVTGAHVALASRYLPLHASEAAQMQNLAPSLPPRLMMLVTGPVIGLISGVVIGSLVWLAGRWIRPSGRSGAAAA